MTSLAFVFGLFPMSIATGPSAQGNHSISIGAAGGMVSGVILGLLIIPVLFVIFQALQERITGVPVPVLASGDEHQADTGHQVAQLQEEYSA
jgi:HAE1 family hydrophobic/amphiphilic exporter-1